MDWDTEMDAAVWLDFFVFLFLVGQVIHLPLLR